jgi:hypothetical protein
MIPDCIGVKNGFLANCPDTPSCVSSQDDQVCSIIKLSHIHRLMNYQTSPKSRLSGICPHREGAAYSYNMMQHPSFRSHANHSLLADCTDCPLECGSMRKIIHVSEISLSCNADSYSCAPCHLPVWEQAGARARGKRGGKDESVSEK